MLVRCPHCLEPLKLDDDSALSDIVCESCGSNFSIVADQTIERQESYSQIIGHFELIERVGSGGFGTVWRARDTQLDRIVALKMPRKGQLSMAEGELFFREARAAAQLAHPHIVSVHEVGRDGETIYIVSDFVQGLTLADWLTGQRLTWRESAALCAKIADALAHAHKAGVVHRDLKPSNIMLDADGEPQLMDFGLAKREAVDATVTMDGQVLGTPAYMSPEQALGRPQKIGRRSDLYSLGVILYELLTGELPFRGSRTMLIHQLLHDEPRLPRKLNNHIPRDLETICLKAMAKEPEGRYATADELGDDLRHFLAGEPIRARPVGPAGRLWRWSKRQPAVATLAALVVLSMLGGTAISSFFAVEAHQRAQEAEENAQTAEANSQVAERNAEHAEANAIEAERNAARAEANLQQAVDAKNREAVQREEAEAQRQLAEDRKNLAEQRELAARRYLYAAHMNLVEQSWQRGRLGHAVRLLERHRPKPGEEDLRGFEWHYLWSLCHQGHLATLRGHVGGVYGVAISPDGRLLASAGRDETIRLWDLASGKTVRTLRGHTSSVLCVAFSLDGKTLASGSYDSDIQLWDVETGEERRTLAAHSGRVIAVSFTPDGKSLISTGVDAHIKRWDLATGEHRSVGLMHRVHAYKPRSMALSADGSTLAFAGSPAVLIYDVPDLQVRHYLTSARYGPWHPFGSQSAAYSPDGKLLATGGNHGEIKVWDPVTGWDRKTLMGHNGAVMSLVFSSDGKALVSVGDDGTVKLWDMDTEKARTYSHPGTVWAVAISPDDDIVASGNGAGTIKLWQASHPALPADASEQQSKKPIWSLAYSSDGKMLAAGGNDKLVRLWDVEKRDVVAVLKGHLGNVTDAHFSPDGKTLATSGGNFDYTVRLWDVDKGESIGNLHPSTNSLYCVAFSPDGKLLASGGLDKEVRLWDFETRRELAMLGSPGGEVWSVAFSPDSKILAAAGGIVKLWDVDTRQELARLEGARSPVRFSPDGKLLATRGPNHSVTLWNVATGKEAATLAGDARPTGWFDFSPDGKTLISGESEGGVTFWDVAGRRERVTLNLQTQEARRFAYSPSGKTIATGDWNGQVKIWRAATEKEVREQSDILDPRERSANSHLEHGTQVRDEGRHEEAAREYRQAGDLFEALAREMPDMEHYQYGLKTSHHYLGVQLEALERYGDALQAYQRTVGIDPDDAHILDHIAYLLGFCADKQLRDETKSAELYQRIVQLTPKAGRAWWRLGMLRYRAKDYAGARLAFEKSIELGHKSGSSRFLLAMIHWRAGDKQAARASYEQGVEWIKQHGPASKLADGHRAEAAELLGIANKPDPD